MGGFDPAVGFNFTQYDLQHIYVSVACQPIEWRKMLILNGCICVPFLVLVFLQPKQVLNTMIFIRDVHGSDWHFRVGCLSDLGTLCVLYFLNELPHHILHLSASALTVNVWGFLLPAEQRFICNSFRLSSSIQVFLLYAFAFTMVSSSTKYTLICVLALAARLVLTAASQTKSGLSLDDVSQLLHHWINHGCAFRQSLYLLYAALLVCFPNVLYLGMKTCHGPSVLDAACIAFLHAQAFTVVLCIFALDYLMTNERACVMYCCICVVLTLKHLRPGHILHITSQVALPYIGWLEPLVSIAAAADALVSVSLMSLPGELL